jgi:sec-independent protein translocase protein TatB
MFMDLSWSHIFLVLIVALVVVGPKDLPKMMRMVGRWTGKAREMAGQLRRSFDEMARQSELDELRQEIESLRRQKPLAEVESSLHQPILSELHPPIAEPKPPVEKAALEPANSVPRGGSEIKP